MKNKWPKNYLGHVEILEILDTGTMHVVDHEAYWQLASRSMNEFHCNRSKYECNANDWEYFLYKVHNIINVPRYLIHKCSPTNFLFLFSLFSLYMPFEQSPWLLF